MRVGGLVVCLGLPLLLPLLLPTTEAAKKSEHLVAGYEALLQGIENLKKGLDNIKNKDGKDETLKNTEDEYDDYEYYDEDSDYDEYDDNYDEAVWSPPDPNPVAGSAEGPMPEHLDLSLVLQYDTSALALHGHDRAAAEAWVRRVAELAKPHLVNFSPSSVRLNVTRVDYLDKRVRVRDYRKLYKSRPNKHERIAVLVGRARGGLKGVAFTSNACREDGTALSVVSKMKTDIGTARTLAHELGHLLGMQ